MGPGMSVRERLRDFLSWRGWSQETLAERLGVAQGTVSKLITGKQLEPAIVVALGIERLSGEPREDGERWPPGPLRVAEWAHAEVAA